MFKIALEIDIDDLIKKALQIEDKRGRDIVVRRFGLRSPETKTLASLGKEYNLTRERVRQIEASTLKAIKDRVQKEKTANAFVELIETYLKDVGNLRRSDLLARDIAILSQAHDDYHPIFENKLIFLGKVLGQPYIVDETQAMYTVWHTNPEAHSLAKRLVDKLLKHKEHDFEKYMDKIKAEHDLPEAVVVNYLSISKNFDVGPYGHMGADHWLYVNPKTVRDKAYLVLKEGGEPMHFADIARLVNEISERKKAQATVHNELIRDPRFVLTGRGTYFLNE